MKYDTIIIGMGPSSVFCAYELLKLKTNRKILLIEKGKRIENRICPISKTGKCKKCKPICNIIGGFSGAGAFSDGKLLSYHLSSYNNDTEDIYIGGKDDTYIKQIYSKKEIMDFLKYTDKVYLKFGASKDLEGIKNKREIKKLQYKSSKQGLNLVDVPVRHLGTEKSHELYKKLQDYLETKIDMKFETEVTDLIIEENEAKGVKTTKGDFFAKEVILAVGVDGSLWLEKLCDKYNIDKRNGYMDIGIRYELSDKTMKKINELMYEGKFIGKSKPYYDKVRTYCQNPSGFVTPETYDNGCTLVNGHAYKNKKSENTNLAILVSYKLPEPFNRPNEYGFNIAKKANLLSNGNAIVQRLGDLLEGKTTTKYDLFNNSVVPTMSSAFAGDLSYVLDYRTLVNIINFIKKVDKVVPGFKYKDNLLYGPEIKFYGNELVLDKNFQTSVKGLYSIGTGGGLTVGLMLASASGVMMARKLEGK